MNLHSAIFLLVAGILGGGLNAVAGGGSFISFPALLFIGVPPVSANATSSVALWLGTLASSGAYRKRLRISRFVMIPLILASVVGGIAGALLLVRTPAETFLRVIPWLMLGATLLFIFGGRVTQFAAVRIELDASRFAIIVAGIFELAVAVYGGYFGGGVGIVNLAMLAALGMADIHAMNALKSVLGAVINGVAAVLFVAMHAVQWAPCAVTALGAIAGGAFGAHFAQKLPHSWARAAVILTGGGMTIYFFIRAY